MRFFLTGILTLITCMVLHAADAGEGMIFYGDAQVMGKENVYVCQDSSLNAAKPAHIKKKKETSESAAITENKKEKQQAQTTVIPDFPLTPSSSSYFNASRESATIAQQRTQVYSQPGKTACKEKTCPCIKDSDFTTYHPKQRQKLSIAATQCGALTSFGANYPPAFLKAASIA